LNEKEIVKNKNFELENNKKLREINFNLVQSKLNTMYNSINYISDIKALEDKYFV